MNKTTNYQLNQWEKTDRILMDDFNADNTRLESVLSMFWNKMVWETVKDIVTEQDAGQIIVDLSDVHLTDYMFLFLMVEDNTALTNFSVTLGKITDNSGYCSGTYLGRTEQASYLAFLHRSYPQIMLILTGGNNDAQVETLAQYGHDVITGVCSLHSSQVTKLNLSGQSDAQAGLHIKLVGVKIDGHQGFDHPHERHPDPGEPDADAGGGSGA